MTSLAIALLLIAAFFHASWNLIAKRAETSGGGPIFIWLFTICTSILYTPIALLYLIFGRSGGITDLRQIGVVVVSGLLHLGYHVFLQKGYRVGDLSLVYPLARGVAPLLSTAGAIALFGERPSGIALVGAVLASVGVFLLAGGQRRKGGSGSKKAAVRYGLIVASIIATYTLWDKRAVSVWMLSPIVFEWAVTMTRSLVMIPYAAANWSRVKAEWSANRRNILLVGLLSPISYILVLYAMSFTPASYIAPAREVSILVGTAMGARLLNEEGARRRMVGAVAMVVALVALALG